MKFNINGKQKFGEGEKGKASAEQVVRAFNNGKASDSDYKVRVRQRGDREFKDVGSNKAVPVDEGTRFEVAELPKPDSKPSPGEGKNKAAGKGKRQAGRNDADADKGDSGASESKEGGQTPAP